MVNRTFLTVLILAVALVATMSDAGVAGASFVSIDAPSRASSQETVDFSVVLHTEGDPVSSLAVEIGYSHGTVGAASCYLAPGVDKPHSGFVNYPHGCTIGGNCNGIRAGVTSLQQETAKEPLDDGVVFTCQLRMPSNLRPGDGVDLVVARAEAVNPQNEDIDIAGRSTGARISGPPLELSAFLRIGSASGKPGDPVLVSVTLNQAAEAEVISVIHDVAFPTNRPVASTSDGTPDCGVNPAIRKDDSRFEFLPKGCSPGATCTGLRATVVAFSSEFLYERIPDGVLYSCRLTIPANAPGNSTFQLINRSAGITTIDRLDYYVTSASQNGIVTVLPPPTPTHSRTPTRTPTATRTSTPTTTRTPTATMRATNSPSPTRTAANHTPTQTRAPSPTPSPTGPMPGQVHIDIASVAAPAGSTVDVEVTVQLGGEVASVLGGIQNDIMFEAPIHVAERRTCSITETRCRDEDDCDPNEECVPAPRYCLLTGIPCEASEDCTVVGGDFCVSQPDCKVAPGIRKTFAAAYQPPGCEPGVDCSGVRVFLFPDLSSPSTNAPIPDGAALYDCRVEVGPEATGLLPLVCEQAFASDVVGNEIDDVSCSNGTIDLGTCHGDCNADSQVTINEVITGVNIGLGFLDRKACLAFDRNGDGIVLINEVVRAVNNGLFGCQ